MGWQVTWPGEGPGRVGRFEVAQGESAYSFPPLEGVPVAVTLEISVSPVAQSSAVVAYSFHVTGLRSREQRLAVPVQVPALHSLYRTTSTALGKANLIHVRWTPWRSPSQQFCAATQLGSGRARGAWRCGWGDARALGVGGDGRSVTGTRGCRSSTGQRTSGCWRGRFRLRQAQAGRAGTGSRPRSDPRSR